MVINSKRGRSHNSEDDCNKASSSVDRISLLPNEILGFILSFLTHKEATATSILSHRWKYLWILTPKLDIDGSHLLRKVKTSVPKESVPIKKTYNIPPSLGRYNYGYFDTRPFIPMLAFSAPLSEENNLALQIKKSALKKERLKYGRWVDHVITLHRSMHDRRRLEEFRVSFDLSSSHADWIDDWLSYALSRKVESLDLNLIDLKADRTRKCYNFPYKIGNFPNNFKLMKKLCLHCVNVTGEAVEFFLANCPLLEQVSVSESLVLESLKIVQTSPWFKCLEISSCDNLTSVGVRDSNVVTIKYSGYKMYEFRLVNVPLLTELWIRGPPEVFDMFYAVLPQLHTFKICATYPLSWTDSRRFVGDVEMCKLKIMVASLEEFHNDKDSLSPIINLITASPCLERFVLEAPHQPIEDENFFDDASADAVLARIKFKHIPRAYFHLKEVEFIGYRGVKNQFEAMMHLVENVDALKSVVVDPRCFKLRSHRPWDRIPRHKIEDQISARAYAKKQLEKYVPSKINVKIL